VHDHSTHDHGPLPRTGSSLFAWVLIAIGLMFFGISVLKIKK